ncbi:hypothetical protein E4U35_003848 [Claviceps purpurea]|nr:hypothetical protein E4U35_003848 [Claviceps purpurea]
MPTGPSGAGEGDTEGLATDHVSKEASKSGDDVRRTYMHLAMHPIFMFMHVHVSNDRTGCSLHTLRSAASMVDERGGLDIDCMSIEREGDVFLGLALHHVASYRWVRGERIQIKVCEICACAPHRQKDPISDDTFGAEMKKREGLKRREIGFRPMALETNGYCTDVSYAVVADGMIGLGRDLKR